MACLGDKPLANSKPFSREPHADQNEHDQADHEICHFASFPWPLARRAAGLTLLVTPARLALTV
jgi:hypothetical protein